MTQTKRRKRVKKSRKIARIEASVARRKRSKYLPEEFTGMFRPLKKPVTLRVDADVLAWFKQRGRGYQTRINSALRKVMLGERGKL